MTTSDSLLSPALTASPLSGAMTFSTPPSGFIAPAHASYGSCSSWGTAPSSGHPPSQSHPGAWTSERSKSPLSVHIGPPAGLASVPSSYYASPSWGSQASTLQGSWGSPSSVANSVPASHHSSVASIATASSLTLVNVPVGVRGQSALPRSDVYPANLTGLPPSPIHIHLALQDARRLDIDMAGPPPSLGSNHSLSDSAFCPSMTYMDVEFDDGFPPLRLCDHGLTVFTVVSQIWYYMQAKDLSGGLERMQQLPTSRDHAASPSSFHRGARRVDRLGHRTKLVGFRPSKIAGHNRWKAVFSA